MDFCFDESLAIKYKSETQKIRVMSENWLREFMYCPVCGQSNLVKCPNNKPVSDFFCDSCGENFELKSKGARFGRKIADGAYESALKRIKSNENPNLFALQYQNYSVLNLVFIPKYFFTPDTIEKRKPLSETACRAGWVGCNILFSNIVPQGKIEIIKDKNLLPKQKVMERYKDCRRLYVESIKKRGWFFDVLSCVNAISKDEFSLKEVYSFEQKLKIKHPENNNVLAKIRQQLQLMRDSNLVQFLGNGIYKKI